MGRLFGTDGIRGVAGEYPLDAPTLFRIGEALVGGGEKRALIGRDTRASGAWVEKTLRRAMESRGARVSSAGVITTPGLAYLARDGDFDRGVMISASHNPSQYNGVKVFASSGIKLCDQEERRVEEAVAQGQPVPAGLPSGATAVSDDEFPEGRWVSRYLDFLASTAANGGLASLKVVLDCANGAAFSVAPTLFRRLGAEVLTLADQPDGNNINLACGALHPSAMAETVREAGADLGVAFDGDADRAILADEKGNVIDGDFVLYVLGRHFKRRGELRSGCVVTTVMANIGLEVALQRESIRVVRTQVGDRYVLEEMLRGDHEIGGEQSGHTIILRRSPAGDGILAALQVAEIMLAEGRPLSEICRGMEKYPQVLLNVAVREKPDFSNIPQIQRRIDQAALALGGKGRVVIRYSGTEPLARVMVEGENKEEIEALAAAIAESFQRALG